MSYTYAKGGEIMKLEDLKALANHFKVPPTAEQYANMQLYIQELGLDPNSLYQELEMSSRFVQVHRDTSYSNSILQLHSHSFYEVLCCCNTCGAEYLVGSERYCLQKGDIIFVPPGTSHRPLLPDNMQEPYIRDVMWISQEFIDILHNEYFPGEHRPLNHSSLFRTSGTKWEYIRDILRSAVTESEKQSDGWELVVTGMAMTFMAHLKRAFLDGDTVSVSAEKPDLLERVIADIEDNLSNKITLSSTAQRFYVSESTISQTFRKKMGVSFYRFVTQRRLIAAKQMILDGFPLDSVSEQSGFGDYSAFYRAFKREYGISPQKYRTLQDTPVKHSS